MLLNGWIHAAAGFGNLAIAELNRKKERDAAIYSKAHEIMRRLDCLHIGCEYSGVKDVITDYEFVEVFDENGEILRISLNQSASEIIRQAKDLCNK